MYMHQWQLRNKNKGMHFEYTDDIVSPDFEWRYRRNEDGEIQKIGIIGWPNREECMAYKALHEEKAYQMMERGDTITLHTTSTKKKAGITPGTAGIRETAGLIAFIKKNRNVHLYHASQFEDGRHPTILVFDHAPPPKEFYSQDRVVPIKTGKAYFGPLVDRVLGIITRPTKRR